MLLRQRWRTIAEIQAENDRASATRSGAESRIAVGRISKSLKKESTQMSDLVVLDFDGVGTADDVLTKLRNMQKEYLIDLEDACVVVHTEAGKLQVKQAMNLAAFGAASGARSGMLMGALVGLLLLNPLAGMAVGGLAGAGFGALSGSLADYGINDDFIKSLGKTIPKCSSALFLLVRSSTPDKVLPEIEPFNPRVLKTSLSAEQENALKTALTATAPVA
jgi:uncharacterized membrane protein